MIRKLKIHFLIVLGTALLFSICSVAPASAADISSTSVTNPSPNSTVLPGEPYITINPIGNHTIGEVFFINGTTNLPVKEKLTIHVFPVFHPVTKGRSPPLGIVVDRIPIVSGTNGFNHWSVNVTEGHWTYEEFTVHVWSTTFIPEEPIFQVFTMFEPKTTIRIQSLSAISTPSSSAHLPTSENSVATTSQAAQLPVIVSIIAIFTGGIVFSNSINCRKRK